MKKNLIVLALVAVLIASPLATFAKGGGGGGGRGGGGRSSSFSSSRSTSTRTTTPRVSTPKAPSAPKISTKPSTSTVKVTSPVAKTVGGKTFSKKGSVVDANYQPKFSGGYVAPMGSTVYYRQSSALDWLPFYLIMSSQNAHRDAVVTEPAKDGQPAVEKVVKEEGLDTMYVVNWVITILLVLGLIWLAVWYVNRRTK